MAKLLNPYGGASNPPFNDAGQKAVNPGWARAGLSLQAAGVIATEAFDMAGDATIFPEQVAAPRDQAKFSVSIAWQKRLCCQNGGRWKNQRS
jgi:hypothetical protein